MGLERGRTYVEFNIAEKLQGNFEEQATALQTATGAPWMLRSEARARMNLPAVHGLDEPITPLNVLVGGQASPTDSGAQNRNAAPLQRVKVAPTKPQTAKANEVLTRFFKRQRAVVLSALGAKADAEWWDAERWDAELGDDLLALSLTVTTDAAKRALETAGGNPDDFDEARTMAYLKAKAKGTAEQINTTTKAALDDALADNDGDPAAVFDDAEGARSTSAAVSLTTSLAAFGTVEAGKQSGGATKTWVTGPNPRPEHARMDGETVAMSDNFSNGMAWPGDPSGGADEVAGCNCSVTFNY